MTAENSSPDDGPAAYLLLQQIKDGLVSFKALDEESKLECLRALQADEYSTAQIAGMLKVSDRTIRRYNEKLRAQHALIAHKTFAQEHLGDLEKRVHNQISYLIRLSRDKDTSPADKIQAVDVALKHLFELTKTLQSCGYLPQQPQLIGAQVNHHVNLLSEQDVKDLEVAVKESIGMTPKMTELLAQLHSGSQQAPDEGEKRPEDNATQATG